MRPIEGDAAGRTAQGAAVKCLEVSLYVLLRKPKDAIDQCVDDLGRCHRRIVGLIQGLAKTFPAQAMRDPGQCPGRIRTKRLRTIERRRQQRENRSAVTATGQESVALVEHPLAKQEVQQSVRSARVREVDQPQSGPTQCVVESECVRSKKVHSRSAAERASSSPSATQAKLRP